MSTWPLTTAPSSPAVILAPDAGDELARARRLLNQWLVAEPGIHAVLARTNIELAPFAAVALERGIAYRAAEDGLALDDPRVAALLDRLPHNKPLAPALACETGAAAQMLLGWSLAYRTVDDLRKALAFARARRAELRRDDAQLVLAMAHGTKGLEFDHVAVIGLDENVFPSRRTLEDSDDPNRSLEEERRLAYVAWTQAKIGRAHV